MSEVEKKESQKTVVAFISGLLIGGLLVWVFSSSPERVDAPVNDDVEVGETTENETENDTENTTTSSPASSEDSEGAISVADQAAGSAVVIDTLNLPTESGWVVVRDYVDGVAGKILGAARYSTDEGLIPKTVELMRGTTAGNTYQVVFFTNTGDKKFDLTEDTLIDGIETTFKAN